MKKIFFVAASLAVLAGSCSKQETAPTVPDAWTGDVSLPVPVEFRSLLSKAAPSGMIEGAVMNNLDLGVYGLELGDDLTVAPWDPQSLWLGNAKVTTDELGNIRFSPARYYPVDVKHDYTFYSYYPYSAAATVVDGNIVKVNYDLGDYDILWAEASAQEYEGMSGFNAAYIRKITEAGQDQLMPALGFTHLLSSLNFNFVLEGETGANVILTGLRVVDAADNADLIIADKLNAAEGSRKGTLEAVTYGEVAMKSQLGTSILSKKVTAEAAPGGNPLLLLPQESYTVDLDFIYGDQPSSLKGLKVTYIGQDGAAVPFQAGKKYNFTVKIKSPVEVVITTTLKPWETPEQPGGDITIG